MAIIVVVIKVMVGVVVEVVVVVLVVFNIFWERKGLGFKSYWLIVFVKSLHVDYDCRVMKV